MKDKLLGEIQMPGALTELYAGLREAFAALKRRAWYSQVVRGGVIGTHIDIASLGDRFAHLDREYRPESWRPHAHGVFELVDQSAGEFRALLDRDWCEVVSRRVHLSGVAAQSWARPVTKIQSIQGLATYLVKRPRDWIAQLRPQDVEEFAQLKGTRPVAVFGSWRPSRSAKGARLISHA